jgi:hypothetical protein
VAAVAAYLAEQLPVHQEVLAVEPHGEEMALAVLEPLVKVMLAVLAVLVIQSIHQTVAVALERQERQVILQSVALAELVWIGNRLEHFTQAVAVALTLLVRAAQLLAVMEVAATAVRMELEWLLEQQTEVAVAVDTETAILQVRQVALVSSLFVMSDFSVVQVAHTPQLTVTHIIHSPHLTHIQDKE